jgi:hypothetical protein
LACSFVSVTGYAGCAVLTLSGELDISDAAELSAQLTAAMSGEPWVIVDLADLVFIDCSSLGVLVGREFSVFSSVGLAGFSAGLAKFGSKLAASKAGESVAAAVDGMVAETGSPAGVITGSGSSAGRLDYWGAA